MKDKRDKEKALSQLQEVNFRQNIAKVSNRAHVYKEQAQEFSKFKLDVLNSADQFIANRQPPEDNGDPREQLRWLREYLSS